ncbi:histidine kinase [Rubrivirga sp. IMCC43871]|uniref:histidine kinase n=1 Tax=Rubrivirga sp. IMCC43871 TaxID=3391575 RepID=UPI00398F96F7
MTAPPRWLARALAVMLAALALFPLASLGWSWAEYRRDVGLPLSETPAPGFDGARWADRDGVVAAYVVPRSGAANAGIRPGDRLASIDFLPVETAAEAERQIERATGTVLIYGVEQGGTPRSAEVRIGRTPTFLYPFSSAMWAATGWGFGVVAFLHLLAYLTVAPLARRSPRARRSRRLIGAAFLWVGVNLVRWLWVSVFGPPLAGGTPSGIVFDGLSLLALGGWIAYPALLLDQSVRGRRTAEALGPARWALVVPPVVLAVGVAVAILTGHVGPLPPDAFAVPILFYVCVYVAGASLIMALSPPTVRGRPARIGSALVAVAAVAGAFVVSTRLGPGPRDGEILTAWFVLAFQLFSLLPVALVSFTTLRYGAFDALLVGSAETVVTLALAFGIVVGGALALDAVLPGGSQPVALGVLVVAVLLVAERAAPALRGAFRRALQTERQQARARLDRFGDRIRSIADVETLAQEAAEAIGDALGARSAVVFLLAARGTPDERWVRATFRPEPPTFTEAELDRVWARIRDEGRVWARNEELDEADLPRGLSDRLRRLDAALAVPVTSGPGEPAGLLVLGRKARRLSVYDTEDVAQLRAMAAQLAVGVERLRLVDRERALVRQTADAELAALRAQINPHFLFNALNTVAALIGDKPDQAEATVEDLAALFRDVLTASGRPVVPLRDELRLVGRYLAIESARFGDKLAVTLDIDPDAEDVAVPAFAVQTLVENAVKHGVEKQRGGGAVTVTARRAADSLTVVVEDTGVGLPPGGATFGVGLSNVADRLRLLHGDAASLTVAPTDDGARATLLLPLPDLP